MPRRPEKTSDVNPDEAISLDFLIECADRAVSDKDKFLRVAATWPVDRHEQVLKAARRRYGSNPAEGSKFRCLISCLKQAPELAEQLKKKRREQKIAQEQTLENRKADSKLSRKHPMGDLIGSTPTIGYKSPGQKKHWGTPRKRRR